MKTILFIFSVFYSLTGLAIVDGHEYIFADGNSQENQQKANLFRSLSEELRCPKCQNQNLADSNAMIAGDLRRELYQQVKAGGDEQSIIEFMVNRYGEFVLYRPKVNTMTYVLWFGPVALLLIALICLGFIVRKRKQVQQSTSQVLSGDQQKRLEELLGKDKGDGNV
ncbi:cytochrome c maturation protein CcmH [Oceaniserpentilla sp. 4NH20-0058]|uniref:cytochrome c-type biogenesis protein n=1 Tax=Oceaniserpentilla sp. 4NH20-0058 TaxID=3127660 RepID=UPI003108E512